MGLGWLPLEKVPVFIWGIILITVSAFLFFHADNSRNQLIAILMAAFGIFALIYDLKKRFFAKIEKPKDD